MVKIEGGNIENSTHSISNKEGINRIPKLDILTITIELLRANPTWTQADLDKAYSRMGLVEKTSFPDEPSI